MFRCSRLGWGWSRVDKLRSIQLWWLLKMTRSVRQERKDDAVPTCPQCVHSIMGTWGWGEAAGWISYIKHQPGAGLRTFSNFHFPGGFQPCALTCSFSGNSCRWLQIFVLATCQTPWPCYSACGQNPPRSCWASTRWRGRGEFGDSVTLWMEW